MKKVVFLFCSVVFLVHHLQTYGQLIKNVSVTNSEGESYTLFLPDQFKKGEQVPIIISFAPDGVGEHGVAPFIPLAQERGIIIVSSNDARNGPRDVNLDIAQRLFNHIFAEYTIDPHQIYLAGFSGGSRLASTIASLSNNISGVIACGASFSGTPNVGSIHDDAFVWVGIIGDRDFNYTEMLETSALLKKLNYPHAVQQFSGSHQWPPGNEIKTAFRFMELKLHSREKITLSRKQIEEYLEKDYQRVSDYLKSNDLIKTLVEYDRIIAGYEEVIALDTLRAVRAELISSKAYKDQKKWERKALEKEKVWKEELNQKFRNSFRTPAKDHWKYWKKKISQLKESSEKRVISNMRSRVLYWLYVLTITGENPMLSTITLEQKEFVTKLRVLIREG